MNCPQCRTPNRTDSVSCVNCGARLPAAAPASSAGYYGQSAPGSQYSPTNQYPPAGQQPTGYPQGGGQYQPQRAGGPVSPFQFDFKRLTRVDQIVGGASLIALISIFLPWFSISVGIAGISESTSVSGTSAHGWLWLLFVIDLLILAYLVARAGWEEMPVRLPIAHAPLLIVATGLQFLLVVIAFFAMPGDGGFGGVSIGWAWGAFVGLIAALAAAGPVMWPAAQSYMQSRR